MCHVLKQDQNRTGLPNVLSSTHLHGTAAPTSTPTPGQDPPGTAANPVHQRPNQSHNSHIAQPVCVKGNIGHQRQQKSYTIPPSGNSVNNAQRQTNHFNKSNNKKKQAPKPSCSTAHQSRPAPLQFCHHCKHKDTESSCLRKTKCDYCYRQGHSIQDCHTRFTEERQQQLLYRISTEHAQNNANLVQSLSRLLALASLHPAAPAPLLQGNWAAQPILPSHQQSLQAYSGLTQPPYSYPGVWSHAGQ